MAIKLSNRERYSIAAAVACILVFVFIQWGVFPLIDGKRQLQRALQVKTGMLDEMADLAVKYDSIRRESERITLRFSDRDKGFALFSFLDRLAGEVGIKDKIAYMKPSRIDIKNSPYKLSSVEMKLQGITLNQLMTYLYRIETSKNMVGIKRISISKEGKQNQLLTAVLQAETAEK